MTATSNRLHVLVIDDDPVVLVAATGILESMGWTTATYDQGLGATSVVLDEKPHVILLDINLPGLNGDKLVGVIDKRRWTEGAPWPIVILHSARSKESLEEVAKKVGAAGAISKTPDARLFKREFERIVERRTSEYDPG